MISKIHTLRCECGWQFMSLSQYSKYCPQCRDSAIEKKCLCCGTEIKSDHRYKYCNECSVLVKRTYGKHYMRAKREKEKYKFSDKINDTSICNYDCFNCKFSECLIPVDKEDTETGNLFEV